MAQNVSKKEYDYTLCPVCKIEEIYEDEKICPRCEKDHELFTVKTILRKQISPEL